MTSSTVLTRASVVFRRPDGRWIGLDLARDGASLRIEDKQKTVVIERLSRRLGPEAREPKQRACADWSFSTRSSSANINTSRGHREHKEPDLEAEPIVPAVGRPS